MIFEKWYATTTRAQHISIRLSAIPLKHIDEETTTTTTTRQQQLTAATVTVNIYMFIIVFNVDSSQTFFDFRNFRKEIASHVLTRPVHALHSILLDDELTVRSKGKH